MKTIFLGDIHGRTIWKQIVEKEQDADRIIFVGDYFDSPDISGVEQLHNFLEIVNFKKNSNKEVVLLFGNHDYHYMPGYTANGYSGYQAGLAYQFRDAINSNLDHFRMAYTFDDILCSHAGISYVWLKREFNPENDESSYNWSIENIQGIVDMINDCFVYTPRIFNFNGLDPYGDDVYQTPIWIRPKSLQKANSKTLKNKVIQIVGHTSQNEIDIKGKTTGGRYFYIDCLNKGIYLIHENDKFSMGQVND